jgi:hypothetical protein
MSDDRGDRLTDIRRGGKAIAEYLELPEYQVYRTIEAKHIPAGHLGGNQRSMLIGSKRRIAEALDRIASVMYRGMCKMPKETGTLKKWVTSYGFIARDAQTRRVCARVRVSEDWIPGLPHSRFEAALSCARSTRRQI